MMRTLLALALCHCNLHSSFSLFLTTWKDYFYILCTICKQQQQWQPPWGLLLDYYLEAFFSFFGFVFDDSLGKALHFVCLFVTYVGSDIFLTFLVETFQKLGGISTFSKGGRCWPFTSSQMLCCRQGKVATLILRASQVLRDPTWFVLLCNLQKFFLKYGFAINHVASPKVFGSWV